MHILRRTQGIDLKAKSGAIRGDVCLQLKDTVTGKVTFEEKGHNMLTIGLDNALNKCPYGLNKVDTSYSGSGATGSAIFKVAPIFSQLMGGVLLFPTAIGNDANECFPSFSNSPTAIASMESYTQADSRQGTFDSVTSGEITGGFKYVYSWGSSYGNGQIASVGLAPRNAHVWVNDPTKALQPPYNATDWTQVQGIYKSLGISNRRLWTLNDKYLLTNDTTDSTSRSYGIKCYKMPMYNANILFEYSSVFDNSDTVTIDGVTINRVAWKKTCTQYLPDATMQIIGDYLYIIERSSTTFTVEKITLATGVTASTDTYTFSGATFGSGKGCIYDGYIYWGASTSGKIYKCNMSNTADISEITDASFSANTYLWYVGTKWIYSNDGILDGDTGLFKAFSSKIYPNAQGLGFPVYDAGMWLVNIGGTYGIGIGAQLKQWGLMTHYDLQNVVTKSSDKQMVLNYSITQV